MLKCTCAVQAKVRLEVHQVMVVVPVGQGYDDRSNCGASNYGCALLPDHLRRANPF